MEKLISYLFHSQTQVHIFHLQTTSFAEHKALQGYYEGIDDLIDGLVETYQGKYGIINGYSTFKMLGYTNKQQVITYFEALAKTVLDLSQTLQDSYLQNQIDEIMTLIESTLYKLKYLN